MLSHRRPEDLPPTIHINSEQRSKCSALSVKLNPIVLIVQGHFEDTGWFYHFLEETNSSAKKAEENDELEHNPS